MTTNLVSSPDQVNDQATDEVAHEAVVVTSTGLNTPIAFDVSLAAIAEMKQRADSLIIAGPEDKAGFNSVHELWQTVRRQRLDVENKRKELKRPHLDYNRDVEAAADLLIEPLESIEDSLKLKEKAYNDERARIAHEKAMFLQNRTEGRVKQLRAWGFVWNEGDDIYQWDPHGEIEFFIQFDDIKNLDDEAYAPTLELAEQCYSDYQAWLEQQRQLKEEERLRIEAEEKKRRDQLAEQEKLQQLREKAIQDAEARLAAQQKQIDDALALVEANKKAAEKAEADQKRAAELKRLVELTIDRVNQLVAAGFVLGNDDGLVQTYEHGYLSVNTGNLPHFNDDQFTSLLVEAKQVTQAIEQAKKEKAEREASEAKAKLKADKARQTRLAPEKKKLTIYFRTAGELVDPKLTEPETAFMKQQFDEFLATTVGQYLALLESL